MQNSDSNNIANEIDPPFEGGSRKGDARLVFQQIGAPNEIRAQWMEEALEAMVADLAGDHFSAALGHFREALCLSQGLPELRALAAERAAQQSKKLLPRNWRVAEVLLEEAAAGEAVFNLESDLREKLWLARYEELIAKAVYQADRAAFDGKVETARARIQELLTEYPSEQRLSESLAKLDRPLPEESPSEPNRALIKADQAASRVAAMGTGSSTDLTQTLISGAVWDSAKNFLALAVTTGMLAIAGILMWKHFSVEPARPALTHFNHPQSPAGPPSLQPVTAPAPIIQNTVPPDEQAWELVKTSNNAASIRSFMSTYPSSAHVLRAKIRLAAVEWNHMDKSNVQLLEAYIEAHPGTPYTKEAQRLVAEANLRTTPVEAVTPLPSDRDAVLEAVRAYRKSQPDYADEMSSDVLQEPAIEGDQATVSCNPRSANSPVLTFSLVKRDGVWKVENVR